MPFKLALFLFDFGVFNTTDDDCEQQVPSVALRLHAADNTGSETTVALGLQQFWYHGKSNGRGRHISYLHILCIET